MFSEKAVSDFHNHIRSSESSSRVEKKERDEEGREIGHPRTMDFLALILTLVFYFVLKSRIEALEKKITVLENASARTEPRIAPFADPARLVAGSVAAIPSRDPDLVHDSEAPLRTGVAASDIPDASSQFTPPTATPKLAPKQDFSDWLRVDWPMKVGALFLILAVGWFVTYAFVHDWIGPVGRVALGIAFGCALLVFGSMRSWKNRTQGGVLLFVGAISLFLTILVGMDYYGFFSPLFALLSMFFVTAFIGAIAFKQDNLPLAASALVFGGIVPGSISDGADMNIVFLYLFVLCSGVLFFAYSRWRVLAILSLFIVTIYSFGYEAMGGFDKTWKDVVFAFMFLAVFYAANMRAMIAGRIADRADLFVAGWIGLLSLAWMNLVAPEDARTTLIVFCAFLFAVTAYALSRITLLKDPMMVYSAVAVTLLAAATARELEGNALAIAYAFEFGLLTVVGLYMNRYEQVLPRALTFGSVAAFAIPFFLSIESVSEAVVANAAGRGVGGNLITLALLGTVAAFIAFSVYFFRNRGAADQVSSTLLKTFASVASFYGLLLFWYVLHLIIPSYYVASMVALVAFTVAGLIFFLIGTETGSRSQRAVGTALFVLVAARLLLVEFWSMTMAVRIVTFFIIGILFVSTAFFKNRTKD
jgi:uncharacterized membrane protein